MKANYKRETLIEKEKLRMQIDAQVAEFLRRGGEISVLTAAGFLCPLPVVVALFTQK